MDETKRVTISSTQEVFLNNSTVIIILSGNLMLKSSDTQLQLLEMKPGEVLGPFPNTHQIPRIKLVASQITLKPSVLLIEAEKFISLFKYTLLLQSCQNRAISILQTAEQKISAAKSKTTKETDLADITNLMEKLNLEEILENPVKLKQLYKRGVLSDYPLKVQLEKNLQQRVKDLVSNISRLQIDSSGLENIRMNRRDQINARKDALDIIQAIYYMSKANQKVSKKVTSLLRHNHRLQLIDNPAIPPGLLYEYLMQFSIYLGKSKQEQLNEALQTQNSEKTGQGGPHHTVEPPQAENPLNEAHSSRKGFKLNRTTGSAQMNQTFSSERSAPHRTTFRSNWHIPQNVPAPTSQHYHESVNTQIAQNFHRSSMPKINCLLETNRKAKVLMNSTLSARSSKSFHLKESFRIVQSSQPVHDPHKLFLTHETSRRSVSNHPIPESSDQKPVLRGSFSKSLSRIFVEKISSKINATLKSGSTNEDTSTNQEYVNDAKRLSTSKSLHQLVETAPKLEYYGSKMNTTNRKLRDIVVAETDSNKSKPSETLRISNRSYLSNGRTRMHPAYVKQQKQD